VGLRHCPCHLPATFTSNHDCLAFKGCGAMAVRCEGDCRAMEQLGEKLSTLADGTQAVALVLANWQNVLRAISMASTPLTKIQGPLAVQDPFMSEANPQPENGGKLPLPITLVRIPTQHYVDMNNPS